MPEELSTSSSSPSPSPDSAKAARGWLLGLVMFVLGACGLAYEYTFSKLASDLLGNTVKQWSIIIALMLFAMGMGAEWQRHIKRERLADRLIESQVWLALAGSFGPLMLLVAFAYFPLHFALVQYGFSVAVGLLIGLEIPLIARINEMESPEMRINLARVLKMDYIGALAGALLWIFLLLRTFGVTEIGFVLGLTTLATSAFCLWLFKARLRRPRLVAAWVGLGTVLVGWGLKQAEGWTWHAEQALFRDQVIFSETTRYQHVVLTRGRSGNLRCYINGNLQFSSTDEAIYHEHLVHPAMHLAARKDRVLILGGGDGLALREVLKYPEVKEVVLVDIDPEMTRLAKENEILRELNQDSLRNARVTPLASEALREGARYPLAQPHHRQRFPESVESGIEVSLLHLDAAAFVRQATGHFHVAILDFPDPSVPDLAKLYSDGFYRALKERLSADGIMVQQSTSPVHAKEAFLCIGRTMEASGWAMLPYHDNVPSFGEWGWWIGGPKEVYRVARLRERLSQLDALEVETRYLTAPLIHASLHFGKDQLRSEEKSITTLTQSPVLEYYLQAWGASQ